MALLHCYDGVTASAIPPAALVLGYLDGNYATYDELHARFQDSSTLVVSVTTGVNSDALVLDCEDGDATPEQAADWCRFQLSRNRRPTVYGTSDTLASVQLALRSRRYRADLCDYWLADWVQSGYGRRPVAWPTHLPHGTVAWQFATNLSHQGHLLDASVVGAKWARRHGWTGRRRQLVRFR